MLIASAKEHKSLKQVEKEFDEKLEKIRQVNKNKWGTYQNFFFLHY